MNEKKIENRFILKNLICFCLVFFLNLSSNNAIIKLQSIINQQDGIGITGLLVGCFIQFFVCIVFPQLLYETIGIKVSMCLASFAGIILVGVNLYATWYTLMIGSIVNGIFATVAWTIVGIYLQMLSKRYAKCNSSDINYVKSLFFGLFGSIVLFSNVLGSIIIGVLLRPAKILNHNSTFNFMSTINDTLLNIIENKFDYVSNCGTSNCPQTRLPETSSKPSKVSIYLMCATLMIISFVSGLIALLFIDEVNDDNDHMNDNLNIIKSKKLSSISKQFHNEFKNLSKLSKLDLTLLLPISILVGFELTFMWTEFNRAFISCLASINYIGWTNILFGTLGALFSFFFGYISKYTTTVPLMCISILTSFYIGIFLLSWTPIPNLFVLFMLNVAFALTQSITNGQLRTQFSIQFKNNTCAFSAATLFMNIGFMSGFLSSAYLCVYWKTLIYVCISLISLMSYGLLVIKNNYKLLLINNKNKIIINNGFNNNNNNNETSVSSKLLNK